MRLAYWAVVSGVACAAALTAAGCAIDPAVNDPVSVTRGSWIIERGHDRITNHPISSAGVETIKVANSEYKRLFGTGDPASLQLACFKGTPIVNVRFPFQVGSTRNAELGYAFDSNPGHQPRVRFVSGYQAAVIEDPEEVARFAEGLSRAQIVYVRIRSFAYGRTSAEFTVDGASAAIASAYADCPIATAVDRARDKAKPGAKNRTASKDASNVASNAASKPAALAAAPAPVAEPEDDEPATAEPPRWRSEEEAALGQIGGWFGRSTRR